MPAYKPLFERAFGAKTIDADAIAKAIAAYERTLITPGSAYDRFAAGDASALNEQQKRGLETFAATGCTACHNGPNRSEEHTSELQSLMRISYAVFCLKKKTKHYTHNDTEQ